MKPSFNEALAFVLAREGIYSNYKGDGETFQGINRVYWYNWEGWPLVDAAQEKNEDLRLLSMQPAMRNLVSAFYRNQFWLPLKCNELPFKVAFLLFDGAVNSGADDSVEWLQRACNDLGESLKVDGDIGKLTVAATLRCNPLALVTRMHGYRLKHYLKLRKTHPQYLAGWVNRVAELMLHI